MFTAAANYNKKSLRKTGEKTANKVSEAFQTELCLCSVVTERSTDMLVVSANAGRKA